MAIKTKNKHTSKTFALRLVAFGVFINGALVIYDSLLSHLIIRRDINGPATILSISVIIGVTLIYLSTLINRRKYVAWLVTLAVYSFLLVVNLLAVLDALTANQPPDLDRLMRNLIVPVIVVTGLIAYRHDFNVRSDIRNFALSLRFMVVVLAIAFIYGVAGMQILDRRDFHQDINFVQAAHYTVDQFGLTTNHVLTPYTNRARVFLLTLSLVSGTSLIYVIVSLFQPLKARFIDQTHQREHMAFLLSKYGGTSEDFFKIWPHDKGYLFSTGVESGLAFRVHRGVAMVVGDPAGNKNDANLLLNEFQQLCRTNDWAPVFVHTEPNWNDFYDKHRYSRQKLGEEAIVDLEKFVGTTSKNKYFRNITNKFTKLGYTTDLLLPPHSDALISRLQKISNEWLKVPGREERGIVMGYFTPEYMQMCPIMIARDDAGTIQCFINQIKSFNPEEANYDLLRQSADAPGNVNDYLITEFTKKLQAQGFKRLNMGLSPFAGLEDEDQDRSMINNALSLLYSRGDRFYSFSGLNKFKQKYEPEWQDRYIVYKGGIRGATRALSALNKAMVKAVKYKI